MLEATRVVYWDANLFLAYIRGAPALQPWVDVLFARAGSPRPMLLIVTSMIAITEIAFAEAERSGRVLEPAIEAEIDRL